MIMANQKPLPAATRKALRQIAAAFVCAEVEDQVISRLMQEKTGQPYDSHSPDSYLNTYLSSEPETRRLWNLLQKDITATRQEFAARLRRERDS